MRVVYADAKLLQIEYGFTNRGLFSPPAFPKNLPRNDNFVGMTSILCSMDRLINPLGSHCRVAILGAAGVGCFTCGSVEISVR
jgi:hypothetical protein